MKHLDQGRLVSLDPVSGESAIVCVRMALFTSTSFLARLPYVKSTFVTTSIRAMSCRRLEGKVALVTASTEG